MPQDINLYEELFGEDCCHQSVNPKELMLAEMARKNGGNSNSASAFGTFHDPILDEAKDKDRIRETFVKWPVVPFLDDSDATLKFLRKLKELSPSQGGIIESVKTFVIESGIGVQKKKRSFFTSIEDQVDVSIEEETRYIDFLTSIISEEELRELSGSIYENYKVFGNAYLEVCLSEFEGQRSAKMYNHDVETVRKLCVEEGDPEIALISPLWEDMYLERNDPDFIPIFPEFSERNGVKRTMIHLKNKVSGRDVYGLPDSISSLYFQFLEMQLGEYPVSEYANDFTGKVFFQTFMDSEDQEETQSFRDAMQAVFTRRGRGESVLHQNAGFGGERTRVHEFNQRTKEEYHEKMSYLAERQILKSHNWHSVLFQSQQGRLGQSNEFENIFKIKYRTVVIPLQEKVASVLNQAIHTMADFLGESDIKNYSLVFNNALDKLLQDLGDKEEDETLTSVNAL